MDLIKGIKLKVASPEDILRWSYGEVLKPETINYRTQRPEKDGLFSERIFGPTKDYECYCGKYKKIRYRGVVCDKCGVEVVRSSVRRERMGHIKLAAPVSHIWFLRSAPSRIGLALDVPLSKLEKVIYYAAYVVTKVDEDNCREAIKEIDRELKSRQKAELEKEEELKTAAASTKQILNNLKVGSILTELEFNDLSRKFGGVFQAAGGAEGILEILKKMDFKKEVRLIEKEMEKTEDFNRRQRLARRLKFFVSMIKNNIKPEWMVMTVLPILPPDLRPMVALDGGRYATSDLNDLYRRVINRNNRLKKLLELKAPEIIIVNEKRMLQEAVDALIDNTARAGRTQMSSRRRPLRSLADMLKGKQGRFRQNLLGKRVDYSGRSVIVVGPRLKYDECGLPKKMALELFKPFVINKILERGLAYNIKNANRLIETATPEVWEILEEVIVNRRVLLNRAPTLHRLGIQAFKPVLIEDLCVQIPALTCHGFNADFDGDQMAVHLPLTQEAQAESETLMLSRQNVLKPASGDPILGPWNDIILGIYFLTNINSEAAGARKVFSSESEALVAYECGIVNLQAPIKIGKDFETTCGRLIFNRVLPSGFEYVNEKLNKKSLSKLVGRIINQRDLTESQQIIDAIQQLGFEMATRSGISWGMSNLVVPEIKVKIIDDAQQKISVVDGQYEEGLLTEGERRSRVIEIWTQARADIETSVKNILSPQNPVYQIIDSDSRGSWEQINQMIGIRGLVKNPQGEIIDLPVLSCYKEGFSPLEYFISVHGNRKGLVDTALKTAEAGYLTRRMVDVAQSVIVKEKNCRTQKGIEIKREEGLSYGHKWSDRIFSRTALEDIKVENKIIVRSGEIIDQDKAKLIENSNLNSVKVRSPLACNTLYGVCVACYGLDLGRNQPVKEGEAVGVIAAQSIGEPGTQLTMRTTHAGGVAKMDITSGLPRIEELLEVRPPKGKALLSAYDGQIIEIKDEKSWRIITIKVFKKSTKTKKDKEVEYRAPRPTALLVEKNQEVSRGDVLTEGHIDLRELYAFKGKEAVCRYVLEEIQKIYISEGAAIHNKHIEILICQMFDRLRIIKPGDSNFVVGEIIDKSRFSEINQELKKKDKEPAEAEELLLGITKAALTTEGFLSAASFQETARVLVAAAAEGRIDYLRGLKESVIIGQLLPIGTNFRGEFKDLEQKSDDKDDENNELTQS